MYGYARMDLSSFSSFTCFFFSDLRLLFLLYDIFLFIYSNLIAQEKKKNSSVVLFLLDKMAWCLRLRACVAVS